MQIIHCNGLNQFIEVIASLVQHGLTFEADADRLVIRLLGGY